MNCTKMGIFIREWAWGLFGHRTAPLAIPDAQIRISQTRAGVMFHGLLSAALVILLVVETHDGEKNR